MNMKKRIAVLSILAGIGAVTFLFVKSRGFRTPQAFETPTRKPTQAELRKAFPSDSQSVFEQSEKLTLYSLEPETVGEEKGAFHRYRIVGQTEIKDKTVKAGLIAHFYNGMAEENIAAHCCFNPRHALRAMRGKKTVDLVICFSCAGVEIHYGEEQGRTYVSKSPQPFFDHVLTSAGVPLGDR